MEVLVKEALMEAQRLGAEFDVLRLTDLEIEPCKGCILRFQTEDCKFKMIGVCLRKSLKKATRS